MQTLQQLLEENAALRQRLAAIEDSNQKLQITETALRDSEARYRTLVEGSVQGISIVSEDRIRLFANATYARMFGYDDPEELIGRPVIERIAPHDHERTHRHTLAQRLGKSDSARLEYQGIRKDGSLIWIESTVSPVSWEGQQAFLVTMVDITERKQGEQERLKHERQMQQTQKLESLGVLAGGIAHDFNNLLTGILNHAGMAQRSLAPDHPAQPHMREVQRGGKLAAHLAGQLLAYAGKGQVDVRPLALSNEVRHLEPLLKTAVQGKARLVFDLAEHLPAIEADPVQLQQVLLNLTTNAAESRSSETVIRLKTYCARMDTALLQQLVAGHNMQPGTYVVLAVQDNGCGMDDVTRQRIFDPFFTTKVTGSGLGLAATLGIMHRHQGGIRLVSNVGSGTTFQLFFPPSTKRVESIPEATPQDLSGHGVVLVVDDDEFVLQAAYFVLKSFGYKVLVANDGEQAIEVFRARHREIDLVVLDMTMPGLGGEETFHVLRQLEPQVKVLFSTAYDEAETASRFTDQHDVGYLPKPYEPEQLAARVKHLLGQHILEPAAQGPESERLALHMVFRQQLPGRLAELASAIHTAHSAPASHEALRTAHRLAHMLKGTAGSFGFENLAAEVVPIEQTLKRMLTHPLPLAASDWAAVDEHLERARDLLPDSDQP